MIATRVVVRSDTEPLNFAGIVRQVDLASKRLMN